MSRRQARPAMTLRRGSAARGCWRCCGWLGSAGDAAAARFALLIGNNEGQRRRRAPPLRRERRGPPRRRAHAARRLRAGHDGRAARRAPPTRCAPRDGRARRAAARRRPGEHLVVVYYSGHADAQALAPGSVVASARRAAASAVTALPAATRVLILDACQAGVLTRAKGGQPGPGFEVDSRRGRSTPRARDPGGQRRLGAGAGVGPAGRVGVHALPAGRAWRGWPIATTTATSRWPRCSTTPPSARWRRRWGRRPVRSIRRSASI